MKKAIVTGGAGFAGFSLVRELLNRDYMVVCPVRPGSPHNERLESLKKEKETEGQDNLILIPLDIREISGLDGELKSRGLDMEGSVFYHLSWQGKRDDTDEQNANIAPSLDAVRAASKVGAGRILITGSQAEYGLRAGGQRLSDGSYEEVSEDTAPDPVNAYGAAKTSVMYLSRDLSRHLGISWNWFRIFSLYGEYEHEHTMLSYLINCLKNKEVPHLSSCTQEWDYLDVRDAAEAMADVAEKGREGEIYNIAAGDHRPLKEYTECLREKIAPEIKIDYASDDPDKPGLSLRPSVAKLKKDTGWKKRRLFYSYQ